jgi:hypothetical protein
MAGTPFTAGPAFATTSAADVAGVTPASAATYRLVRHIHFANTNAAARTISAWKGASAGSTNGTELVEGKSIAGADVFDLYFPAGKKFLNTDFLTVQAGTDSTSITVTVDGESYAVS